MPKYIVVNQVQFPCISAESVREVLRGNLRNVIRVRVVSNYNTIKQHFSDGLSWSIHTDTDEFDHSDYNLVGDIIDHGDGQFSVHLGLKWNETEELSHQVQSLSGDLSTAKAVNMAIAGTVVNSTEEAQGIRSQIEVLYSKANTTTDEKISMFALCPKWKLGSHSVGDVYCTESSTDESINNQIWECIQTYDNSTYPDIIPSNKSTWGTFNKPYHGTTEETARPWVAPTGAHDMYLVGEMMIWTDGSIYKCTQQTNFSPEEYAQAWEKVSV